MASGEGMLRRRLLRAVEQAGEVEHDVGAKDAFDLLVRALEGLEHVEHEDEGVDGHGLGEELGVLVGQVLEVDLLVRGRSVFSWSMTNSFRVLSLMPV